MNAAFPRWFRTAFLILSCVSLLLSCSRKVRFDTSSIVPAASGTVKYKKDKNSNYAVHAKVLHLAPPSSLSPSRSVYVFWVETSGNGVKNLGRINTDTRLLSKTLRASLDAVTPYEPRSFFITAEDNADITYPGPEVVLRTR